MDAASHSTDHQHFYGVGRIFKRAASIAHRGISSHSASGFSRAIIEKGAILLVAQQNALPSFVEHLIFKGGFQPRLTIIIDFQEEILPID
jgi:hypothetical protein